MNRHLLLSILTLAVSALSAAPTVRRDAGRLVYGDAQLAITFDANSGAWLALNASDAALVVGDAGFVPFDLSQDGQRLVAERKAPVSLESAAEQDGALVTTYRVGEWRVALRWRLQSERGLLVRSAQVTWLGAGPTKLKGFWFRTPPAPMAAGGSYLAPGRYPPERRLAADLATGRSYSFSGSLAPLVAQVGAKQSLCWLTNDLSPYADRSWGSVNEAPGSIQVSQQFDALARMKPGDTQTIGDAHLWAQAVDGEAALRGLHTWMGWVGHVVPADRPAWFADMVLYSLHPGGTTGSGFRDLGGFEPATRELDRIADLGCNALWLLPVEDRSPYQPNDYFKFAAGLGTGEQYKALTARARQLGLRVLQDCVPHGGTNTNERAKAHPEWLVQDEAGGTLDYWCFDFNSSTWRAYMADVARHYVREYGLDGYRVDAVGGSKIPNWNPQLPYARASHAQLQGGLNMLRDLRAAVRGLKPDGGLLAEVQGSVYGTVSDAVYDFAGCYNVYQDLRRQPAEVFVARLRRWLHERDCAEAAGLLRLQHTESHDSLRATEWYGVDGARALMALTAWTPGIPLVYQDGEEGHRDAYQRIFAIRKARPELSRGSADYLSVQAPSPVFACLRRLGERASVVVINFGSESVVGAVTAPDLTGKPVRLALDLPSLGYAVLPLDGQAVPSAAPSPAPSAAPPVPVYDATSGWPVAVRMGQMPVVGAMDVLLPADMATLGPPKVMAQGVLTTIERAGTDGKLVVSCQPSADGVDLAARWEGPRQPSYAALLLPLPGARRWSAETAEGTLADTWHIRHEPGDGAGFQGSIYWRPQGTNVLYDSLLHPLRASGQTLAADFDGRRLAIELASPGTRARWLDRLGSRRHLCALLAWRDPDLPGEPVSELRVNLRAGTVSRPAPATAPLRSVAGGYRFENAHYRLDLNRTGMIRRLIRRLPAEQVIIDSQDVYTDHGFADDRLRYAADFDNEAGCRLEQRGDEWVLRFEGRLRGSGRFDLLRQPIEYRVEYVLSPTRPTFRLSSAVRPSVDAAGDSAFLAQMSIVPAMTGIETLRGGARLTEGAIPPRGRVGETAKANPPAAPDAVVLRGADGPLLRLDQLTWTGPRPANVFADGRNFFAAWVDGKPAGGEAAWLSCSGLWTVGGATPAPLGQAPTYPVPPAAEGLPRDGSFEAQAQATARAVVSGDTLPLGGVTSAWMAPPGGGIVTDERHDGACSARVVSQSGDYVLWRQGLSAAGFAPASRWRLSGWVKGRDIVRGDVSWKVGVLRFAVGTAKTEYVSCPELLGTFDWRRVTVDLTVPDGLKSLEVQVGLNGATGAVWFDGLSIERLP